MQLNLIFWISSLCLWSRKINYARRSSYATLKRRVCFSVKHERISSTQLRPEEISSSTKKGIRAMPTKVFVLFVLSIGYGLFSVVLCFSYTWFRLEKNTSANYNSLFHRGNDDVSFVFQCRCRNSLRLFNCRHLYILLSNTFEVFSKMN